MTDRNEVHLSRKAINLSRHSMGDRFWILGNEYEVIAISGESPPIFPDIEQTDQISPC